MVGFFFRDVDPAMPAHDGSCTADGTLHTACLSQSTAVAVKLRTDVFIRKLDHGL